MQAGKMRHLMRIEVDIVVQAIDKTLSKSRSVIGTTWVHLMPVDNREFGVIPAESNRPSHKVTMRFRPFLPDNFYFISIDTGKEYLVKSMTTASINREERNREFEILVLEKK